jgi:hypothetical protein
MVFNFDDRKWRIFPRTKLNELRVTPNELWGNDSAKEGALIVRQSRKYSEYALGKNGLDYLQAALQKGTIKEAWVVLVERDKDEIVTEKPLAEVVAALDGVEPSLGNRGDRLGPFWWVFDDLTPQEAQGVLSYPADKIPF